MFDAVHCEIGIRQILDLLEGLAFPADFKNLGAVHLKIPFGRDRDRVVFPDHADKKQLSECPRVDLLRIADGKRLVLGLFR